jgi:hypothetical protein
MRKIDFRLIRKIERKLASDMEDARAWARDPEREAIEARPVQHAVSDRVPHGGGSFLATPRDVQSGVRLSGIVA